MLVYRFDHDLAKMIHDQFHCSPSNLISPRCMFAISGMVQAFVFSDSRLKRLSPLSKSKKIELSGLGKEIFDSLIAQSAVFIASLKSSYGYWAGFVCSAEVIFDPHDFGRIRSQPEGWFEGIVDQFEKLEGSTC